MAELKTRVCRACNEPFALDVATCPRCGEVFVESEQVGELLRSYDLGSSLKVTPGVLLLLLVFGTLLLVVAITWFLN